jgi:hypothetical protein
MQKNILIFFFSILISNFAKSDVVGQWEHIANGDDFKLYLNTHVASQRLLIDYYNDDYSTRYIDVSDGIYSNLLWEFDVFQNNGKFRYNYTLISFRYDCALNKINYFDRYIFNRSAKPYFFDNYLDREHLYDEQKSDYVDPGNIGTFASERCQEFYGDQAKYIVDENYLEDFNLSYEEALDDIIPKMGIKDLYSKNIDCPSDYPPDVIQFEFIDEKNTTIVLFLSDTNDIYTEQDPHYIEVGFESYEEDNYLVTEPYIFQNNEYQEALEVLDNELISRWRKVNQSEWEFLTDECFEYNRQFNYRLIKMPE